MLNIILCDFPANQINFYFDLLLLQFPTTLVAIHIGPSAQKCTRYQAHWDRMQLVSNSVEVKFIVAIYL